VGPSPQSTDGWFALAPDKGWAIQAFETRQDNPKMKYSLIIKCRVEYGDPSNKTPVPQRVVYEEFDPEGHALNEERVEIKSVTFGPVPPEKFLLAGYGITEEIKLEPGRKLPTIFYFALVNAVLAFILIVLVRRYRSKHPD
jgi:hypothetical protein